MLLLYLFYGVTYSSQNIENKKLFKSRTILLNDEIL